MSPSFLVVSLGPDDGGLLTEAALSAMRGAERLVLRTGRHGAAARLAESGIPFETLDDLYESAEDFDELTGTACKKLLALAEEGGLCYAVPDPAGDETVAALSRALPPGRLRVLPGPSQAAGAACAALSLGMDARNLRAVSAMSLSSLRPAADAPIAAIHKLHPSATGAVWTFFLSDIPASFLISVFWNELTLYLNMPSGESAKFAQAAVRKFFVIGHRCYVENGSHNP